MTGGKTSWCVHCHHMIVPAKVFGGWGHASDADWSGWGDCRCAQNLIPCLPEPVAVTARFTRQVSALTSAFRSLTAAASEPGRAWASLASAVQQEEKS